MRYRLEDNTQEAFQFLFLGAVIVLVLRGIIGIAGLWITSGSGNELMELVSDHRNGFLLVDPLTVVIGGMDLAGRLSFAALLTIGAGIFFSVIGAGIAALLQRPAIPAAVVGARLGMLLVAAAGLYSALFLPAHSATFDDAGVVIERRTSLPGGLAVPGTTQRTSIPWQDVGGIQQRVRDHGREACGIMHETVIATEQGELLITQSVPGGSDCDAAAAMAWDRDRRLIAHLHTHYLKR